MPRLCQKRHANTPPSNTCVVFVLPLLLMLLLPIVCSHACASEGARFGAGVNYRGGLFRGLPLMGDALLLAAPLQRHERSRVAFIAKLLAHVWQDTLVLTLVF